MLFGKKKEMVDIRDLPKNASMGKSFIPKDGYGFVDLTKKRLLPSEERKLKAIVGQPQSSPSAESTSSFSFFDTPTPSPSPSFSPYPAAAQNYPSTTPNSDTEEALRKISMQISDLDTKIYKMEQRIELLERKAGVQGPSNSGFSW